MTNTKFYTFLQNNSGGHFNVDTLDGIGEYVIIEAHSSKEANDRAEEIGLYFDGCDSGSDCPCCGDRWYESNESDGMDEPLIYGEPVRNYVGFWEAYVFVHYLNKEKEMFIIPAKN